jgi:hypothetical protein
MHVVVRDSAGARSGRSSASPGMSCASGRISG